MNCYDYDFVGVVCCYNYHLGYLFSLIGNDFENEFWSEFRIGL